MRILKSVLTIFTVSLLAQQSFASRCTGKRPEMSIILAIDISSSINIEEMKLQLRGFQSAFESEILLNNFLGCTCAEVSVVYWSTSSYLAHGPTLIETQRDINKISDFFELQAVAPTGFGYSFPTDYGPVSSGGMTKTDRALSFSSDLFSKSSGLQKLLFISGDGLMSNAYIPSAVQKLRNIRSLLISQGVKISGVTINDEDAQLSLEEQASRNTIYTQNDIEYSSITDFYEREVITPYGIVEEATSFANFGSVIERSLARETCNLYM